MEELLNKLIEKGWKPFGIFDKLMIRWQEMSRKVFGFGVLWEVKYSIRELVSKESWLWQFVCENGMIRNEKLTHNWVSQVEWGLDVDCKRKTTPKDYEYRLIESALKDESELEQFLLDNIKIDG